MSAGEELRSPADHEGPHRWGPIVWDAHRRAYVRFCAVKLPELGEVECAAWRTVHAGPDELAL